MAPRKTSKAASQAPLETSEKAPQAAAAAPRKKAAPRAKAPKQPVVVVEVAETSTPAPSAEPVREAKPTGKPDRKPSARKRPVEESTEAHTAVAPSPASTSSDPAVDPFALAMLAAIRAGRAVELIFKDADAYAPRTFEPRLLSFDALSQAWYVHGWDRRYNAERHHCLSLLAEVNPVEGMGRAAQGPYPEGTPANQIGGWLGGEPIPVKVLLFKQWIYAVRQAPPPFPAFQVEDIEDGKAQVTFTGTDLRAIARWCMQFGDGIQIQEPQRLLDRVRQVGVAWAGKAAQPSPAPAHAPAARPARAEHPKPEHPKSDPPRHESRSRPEARPDHRSESRPEPKPDAKGKPGRVEVRTERL